MSTPETPPAAASPTVPKGRGAPAVGQTLDLGRLVREHQAAVWRYLRYLGADPPEAEDLTQETFLAAARSGFEERSPAETAGYLRTVARRQLLMLRRKQSRRVRTVDLDAADAAWSEAFDGGGASAGDLWDDRVEAARRCVEALEGRARQAVDLTYKKQAARNAVADELGMKPDGVKTLLRRTREKLRECIEKRLAASRIEL